MLGHQNQEKLIMLLMVLMEVFGEEVVELPKNLLVLDLLHKVTFMDILMNVNVLIQSLIGFSKV